MLLDGVEYRSRVRASSQQGWGRGRRASYSEVYFLFYLLNVWILTETQFSHSKERRGLRGLEVWKVVPQDSRL